MSASGFVWRVWRWTWGQYRRGGRGVYDEGVRKLLRLIGIVLIAAGVTAISHPGGSVRDQETLAVVNRAGAAMVLTGQRHFKH